MLLASFMFSAPDSSCVEDRQVWQRKAARAQGENALWVDNVHWVTSMVCLQVADYRRLLSDAGFLAKFSLSLQSVLHLCGIFLGISFRYDSKKGELVSKWEDSCNLFSHADTKSLKLSLDDE